VKSTHCKVCTANLHSLHLPLNARRFSRAEPFMKADVLGMTFACRNSDHWCRMEANTGTVLAISGIVNAQSRSHIWSSLCLKQGNLVTMVSCLAAGACSEAQSCQDILPSHKTCTDSAAELAASGGAAWLCKALLNAQRAASQARASKNSAPSR